MFLNLILLPFVNFLLLCFFGRFIGYKGAIRITTCSSFLSVFIFFCFITYLWWFWGKYDVLYVNLGHWICISDIRIDFSFTLDYLSLAMFFIIIIISYLVNLYSCAYMKYDPHFIRFLSYLSLFTGFMLLLVSSDNLLLLFVGWEGVGLCSYLLIGFWYTRI
jgi:NADH:ubiquinone oxidoreductase subunit 5 (subunit L)/multisubunit Na+/H+ antiporter MnhA subunit